MHFTYIKIVLLLEKSEIFYENCGIFSIYLGKIFPEKFVDRA